MTTLLFISRMAVYLIAILVPVFHPAVVVGYVQTSLLIWFLLVPLEMVIAYVLSPPRLSLRMWLLVGAAPIAIVATVIGIDANPLPAILAGLLSFSLTAILFHVGPRLRPLFIVEQLVLGALYFRLLTYSRASEDVAADAAGATQFIFLLIGAAFLLHGIVISLALARGGYRLRRRSAGDSDIGSIDRRRTLREVGIFLFVAIPVLLLAAFALPPNFVAHNPVLNILGNEASTPPQPLDEWAESLLSEGALRGQGVPQRLGDGLGQDGSDAEGGDSDGEGGEDEGEYSLTGLDPSDWGQGGNSPDEQRAVMVVVSRLDPVYAADGYYDVFDASEGFRMADQQPLNDLVRIRLAGTWRPDRFLTDSGRREFDVAVYSTIPDRVLPYSPSRAEPTVYQPRYYPFSYSFRGSSLVSTARPAQLRQARSLSAREQDELASHMNIDLSPEHEAAFRGHLDEHVGEIPANVHDRIIAIMESFRTFQYEIGYDDTFATDHMARFVSEVQSGDCVEFANTAAILGRMVGIPTRVVTGYLATSSLQNPAHIRGLAVLRESLPDLAEYSLDEMYLVTTSHRHAWPQFYIAGHGWVDFEPTSYAIPPPPGGDPNEMRVVIPLINPRDEPVIASFPWGRVGSILLWLAFVTLLGLYLLRYGAQIWLAIRSRGNDRGAAIARYRLLLMRLAARGYELKPTSMTAREYGEGHPELAAFAEVYTRLRYMPPLPDPSAIEELAREYRLTLQAAGRDRPLRRVAELFSLRGLHYV
jgi:transglutaminase-like putative cysteine protease